MDNNNLNKKYRDYVVSQPPTSNKDINYVSQLEHKINMFSCDTKYYSTKRPSVRVVGYVR